VESLRKLLPRLARAALILIGLSPVLPPLLAGIPLLSLVGDAFDAWFRFQCHRETARSLDFVGQVLPVCSRCTGIYWGLGLGAIVLRPRVGPWPLRIWVGAAAALMVLDVWTEIYGLRPASALLRVATGVLLAYPVGVAIVWTARDLAAPEAAA
jgi:uncharacterized membrane protein